MKNYLFNIILTFCLQALCIAQSTVPNHLSVNYNSDSQQFNCNEKANKVKNEPLACAIEKNKKSGGKYTKEKKLTKVYNVNSDCILKINNSYGNVHVTTWNENKISVDILIKSNGNNEKRTIEKLEEAKVEIVADKNMISFKTVFESSIFRWSWGDESNIQINYTVKMPINNNIDLANDYGNIFIDKLNGSAKVSCDYGKIEINELNNEVNELNFDYTSKCKFGYIKNANIVADYSGFEIDKAEQINLRADYTETKINKINKLNFECDYGDIEIKEVKNITAKGDYIKAKIDKVTGSFKLESDYGDVEVNEFSKEAGNVEIKSDYTEIKLGYHPDYTFDFDLNMEYGGIKLDKNLEITSKKNEDMNKKYIGKSSKNTKNKIYINSSFGGITLLQNQISK